VRDRWGVLLGAALAATSALAQSPPRILAGAPAGVTYDGRHCAIHPRFDGPLTLVTGATLPAPAAPAVALLVDASGQVMLVDGPLPLFRRHTSGLLRKSAQLRLEVFPEAGSRAVERCADLIVEGHGWVSRL